MFQQNLPPVRPISYLVTFSLTETEHNTKKRPWQDLPIKLTYSFLKKFRVLLTTRKKKVKPTRML